MPPKNKILKQPKDAQEYKRLEQIVFNDAVKYRDAFKGKGLNLDISDEQLKKNIKSKLSLYIDANIYCDTINRNVERNLKKIESRYDNYPTYMMRMSDMQSVNEKDFEKYIKETNSHLKAEHFRMQTLKNISTMDYKEVINNVLNPRAGINYALNNLDVFQSGFTTTAISSTGGVGPGPKINNFISSNRSIVEGVYSDFSAYVRFQASPINFLFEEDRPSIDIELSSKMTEVCLEKNLFSGGQGSTLDEKDEFLGVSTSHVFDNNKEFTKIKETLESKNIDNILLYKSTDPNKTLAQCLATGDSDHIEQISNQEIDEYNKQFNKFNLAYTYECLSHPTTSNKVKDKDKTRLDKFIAEHPNYKADILKDATDHLPHYFTVDNFEETYEKSFGILPFVEKNKKEKKEIIEENNINNINNKNIINLEDSNELDINKFEEIDLGNKVDKPYIAPADYTEKQIQDAFIPKNFKPKKQDENKLSNFEYFKQEALYETQKYLTMLDIKNRHPITSSQRATLEIQFKRLSDTLNGVYNKLATTAPFDSIVEYVKTNFPGNNEKLEQLCLETANSIKTFHLPGELGALAFNQPLPESFTSKSTEDKIKYLSETIKNAPDEGLNSKKPVIQSLFSSYVFDFRKVYTMEGINKFLAGFEKTITDGKINNFEFPKFSDYKHLFDLKEETYANEFTQQINQLYPPEDEIDEPKNNNLVEALDITKKALSIGKTGSDLIEEHIDETTEANAIAYSYEYMNKQPYFDKNVFKLSKTKSSVNYNNSISNKSNQLFGRSIANEKLPIDEETKKNATEIYEYLLNSKLKIFDKIKNIENPSNYPQGIDGWVKDSYEKLSDAVKRKNKGDIIEYANDYKNAEEDTDHLLEMINKVCPEEFYGGNFTLVRNGAIPSKYRFDLGGTSKLDGLITTVYLCNYFNYDFKKFLDDPVTAFKELNKKVYDDGIKEVNDFCENSSPADLMKSLYGEDISNLIGNQSKNLTRLTKVECLAPLFGKKVGIDVQAKTYATHLYYSGLFLDLEKMEPSLENDPDGLKTLAKRMLLVEPEDRKIFKLSTKAPQFMDSETFQLNEPFDEEQYYREKTSCPAVCLRSLEVFERFKGPEARTEHAQEFTRIAKDVLDTIPEADKSPTSKKVIAAIRDNRLNKITAEDRKLLKEEAMLRKVQQKGLQTKDILKGLRTIGEYEKHYDSHYFFMKWWSSGVKKEKAVLDNAYNKIAQDYGVEVGELKRLVALSKGNEEQKRAFVNLATNMQAEQNERLRLRAQELERQNALQAQNQDVLQDENVNEAGNNNELQNNQVDENNNELQNNSEVQLNNIIEENQNANQNENIIKINNDNVNENKDNLENNNIIENNDLKKDNDENNIVNINGIINKEGNIIQDDNKIVDKNKNEEILVDFEKPLENNLENKIFEDQEEMLADLEHMSDEDVEDKIFNDKKENTNKKFVRKNIILKKDELNSKKDNLIDDPNETVVVNEKNK